MVEAGGGVSWCGECHCVVCMCDNRICFLHVHHSSIVHLYKSSEDDLSYTPFNSLWCSRYR